MSGAYGAAKAGTGFHPLPAICETHHTRHRIPLTRRTYSTQSRAPAHEKGASRPSTSSRSASISAGSSVFRRPIAAFTRRVAITSSWESRPTADGDLFPCGMFQGEPSFRYGNIFDMAPEDVAETLLFRQIEDREQQVLTITAPAPSGTSSMFCGACTQI